MRERMCERRRSCLEFLRVFVYSPLDALPRPVTYTYTRSHIETLIHTTSGAFLSRCGRGRSRSSGERPRGRPRSRWEPAIVACVLRGARTLGPPPICSLRNLRLPSDFQIGSAGRPAGRPTGLTAIFSHVTHDGSRTVHRDLALGTRFGEASLARAAAGKRDA